jgi:hypothetical protein
MSPGDYRDFGGNLFYFDNAELDEIIRRELGSLIRCPCFDITRRWHGISVKRPADSECAAEPQQGVKIIIASGSGSITLSVGLAAPRTNNWTAAVTPSSFSNRSSEHLTEGGMHGLCNDTERMVWTGILKRMQ